MGASAETNRRLIQQAIQIANRAAYRGIEAASEAGDNYQMEVIQNAVRFTLDDEGIKSYMGLSLPGIADLPVIPDGPEGDEIYNALPSGSEYIDANGNRVLKQ